MATFFQIVLINLAVSCDNVGVIAMATKSLPQDVDTSSSSLQPAIDKAITDLQTAMDDFNAAKITVDKKEIGKVIDDAEKLIDDAVIGDKPGEYSQKAVDDLQDALDNSKEITNKTFIHAFY